MQPFSLILDAVPAVASVEEVYRLVAGAFSSRPATINWELDPAGEAGAALELASSNPDALLVLPHALSQRFVDMRCWPRNHATDIPLVKRMSADALAQGFPKMPASRGAGERLRVAILVPWLANNPNNNLLRVVATYLAGLLRHPAVEDAVVVVTNEFATGIADRGGMPPDAKPKADARLFAEIHERVLREFGIPPGKVRYAPPPFSEGGSFRWQVDFSAGFRPDVVFVPNIEMTSAAIHGFGRGAATVYLQTSINNRPPYDFDRYLYLGERRDIDASHIHPGRWRYHSFGYEPFGFGSTATRADMGCDDGDFVMVSAGNRLEKEITPEISGIIADVMGSDPRRKWLLLGARDEGQIRGNMGEAGRVIGDRAVFRSYVWEVGDYLSHCDAYVNPRRTGGAVSMSLAVYGGTPVLSFEGNDACNFLLEEMICRDAATYSGQLRRLADDPAYRADVAMRQRSRFEACHTADGSAADLVVHFRQAIEARASEGI